MCPAKYTHCFVVLFCGYLLWVWSIYFRVASMSLGQWDDCHGASEISLKDVCKIGQNQTTVKHNKAQTGYIFQVPFKVQSIWVRSRRCGCLATWFCYQLIAKPSNKTAAPSWPDLYFKIWCMSKTWIENLGFHDVMHFFIVWYMFLPYSMTPLLHAW